MTPTLTALVADPASLILVSTCRVGAVGKHQGMTRDASATERRPLEALLRALSERPDTIAWGRAFEYVADLALWSSPEFGARIKQIWRIERSESIVVLSNLIERTRP